MKALHRSGGGLLPQAGCIDEDKRHSVYIKLNSSDTSAVF